MVLQATTFRDALAGTDLLEKLQIDVAVLDGNLTPGEDSGDEGRALLSAIRERAPGVKIVGMSAVGMRGTDVDLGKNKVEEIGGVVTNL